MTTLTIKRKDGTEEQVKAEGVQAPPAIHGSFSLGGIPLIAPGVNLAESINPATGAPYIQAGPRPATMISPPPTRNFR